jgi:hypothetical protein
MADNVAKVSRMDQRRNVRSTAGSGLNLPCHVNAADESMLRASWPEKLLQQYRHSPEEPVNVEKFRSLG